MEIVVAPIRCFLALSLALAACAPLPTNDQPLTSRPPASEHTAYPATPIRWQIGPDCTGDPARIATSRQALADDCARQAVQHGGRDFVAVTISGGGAKAATFGGEALFMLERLGLLQHADIVSGVSGGSFAATLYALSCDAKDENCQKPTPRGHVRPVWDYAKSMERLSQGYAPLIIEAVGRLAIPLLPVAIPNGRFADFIDEAYLADAAGRGAGFTFAELNPRRPHLFVSSAIVSGQRFVIDELTICDQVSQRARNNEHGFLRRRAADETAHFAFTDFYFRRLCSDISRYPLARAVAASGAFPALVDYARLRDNARGDRPYELLLMDGGANDNQGLIEVYMTLAEVLGGQRRSDARGNEPVGTGVEVFGRQDRGLILVVNTSLTEATGIDGAPAYSPGLLGYLFGTASRASTAFDRASAANYSTRTRLYLRELALAGQHLEVERGWRGWRDEARLRVLEIGLTALNEYAFGGSEVSLRQARGIWPTEPGVGNTGEIYDPDLARLKLQEGLQGRAFDALRDPAARRRLGLSDVHPQCLYERSKEADAGLLSLASLPDDVSTCLRHAARWSVALRAQELCLVMGGRNPPLNNSGRFAETCRDGLLDLLSGMPSPPLADCRINLRSDAIKALLDQSRARRNPPASRAPIVAGRLPTESCGIDPPTTGTP
jgi:predicted acylesterase/phospholipase RssA